MSDDRVQIINVDDFDPARYAKTRILRSAGFAVAEAKTGRAALEQVERLAPDLVILDVNLPDISGLEVCRIIKDGPSGALVLHTSATMVELRDRVSGLNNGADGYLVEPLEPAELLSTVRALLRLRQTEQDLRQRERQLEELVQQKEALLQELNHRVKNNLQIVASLISLDPQLKGRRNELAERINAIALLHDLLYRPENSGADLEGYLRSLWSSIVRSFGMEDRVELHCSVTGVPLKLDWGVPLGLMINEIVTNSLKHAFTGDRRGRISIDLRPEGSGYRLTVADDGPGFADTGKRGQGLGLRLIDVLARQLGGRAVHRSGTAGACYEITFEPGAAFAV